MAGAGPADSIFRESFAKVPRKFCEGAGESQSAFEGRGPVSCAKKVFNQQQSVLRRDSLMLAACLQSYQAVIRDV
jgi:hypothetical protein